MSYIHYVCVVSDVKEKCEADCGIVDLWKAYLGGGHALMFLPHHLLVKEFVHTAFHSYQIIHNK
jgi:hypothetical protein